MLPDASSTTTLAPSARLVARATSGRPAPDSTAAETSAKASRNALFAGISARVGETAIRRLYGERAPGRVLSVRLRPPVPAPHDRRSYPNAKADQGREDEQRHEAGREALPPSAVRTPPRGQRKTE